MIVFRIYILYKLQLPKYSKSNHPPLLNQTAYLLCSKQVCAESVCIGTMQSERYFESCQYTPSSFIYFTCSTRSEHSHWFWPWIHYRVLGTGPGNLPAAPVWNTKVDQLRSWPLPQPDLLLVALQNPDPYPLTRGLCWVWLDPSVTISDSVIVVSPLIVSFRHATPNRKILSLVHCALFLMYCPP